MSEVKAHHRIINGKHVLVRAHHRAGDKKQEEPKSLKSKIPQELQNKVARRNPGKGGQITLKKEEVKTLLDYGTIGIVSAWRNSEHKGHDKLTDEDFLKKDEELRNDLKAKGYVYMRALGRYYGSEEPSYVVLIPNAEREDVNELGAKYKQDTVLWVNEGKSQVIQTTDQEKTGKRKAGEYTETARKWDELPKEREDMFSQVVTSDDQEYKFFLHLDWENWKKGKKKKKLKKGSMLKGFFGKIGSIFKAITVENPKAEVLTSEPVDPNGPETEDKKAAKNDPKVNTSTKMTYKQSLALYGITGRDVRGLLDRKQADTLIEGFNSGESYLTVNGIEFKRKSGLQKSFRPLIKSIGKHTDRPDSDFDPAELKAGIRVEMEHTDDEDKAKEIAKDHLAEFPDYYTRLIRMELDASEELKNKTDEKPVKKGVHVLRKKELTK